MNLTQTQIQLFQAADAAITAYQRDFALVDPPYNVRAVVDAVVPPESRYQILYDRDDESLIASGPSATEALEAFCRELDGDCRVARQIADR